MHMKMEKQVFGEQMFSESCRDQETQWGILADFTWTLPV